MGPARSKTLGGTRSRRARSDRKSGIGATRWRRGIAINVKRPWCGPRTGEPIHKAIVGRTDEPQLCYGLKATESSSQSNARDSADPIFPKRLPDPACAHGAPRERELALERRQFCCAITGHVHATTSQRSALIYDIREERWMPSGQVLGAEALLGLPDNSRVFDEARDVRGSDPDSGMAGDSSALFERPARTGLAKST